MIKNKQARGDQTAEKILQSACKIFPEHGFSGTSISMLAKEAGINQSLIYHHFGSKEELWKAVKGYLLRDVFDSTTVEESTTLEAFVKEGVRKRFEWYFNHPEMVRMLNWQRLESQRKQLQGTAPLSVDSWVRIIPHMQKEGKIRTDLPAEMIIVMMGNIIIAPLLGEHRFLKNKATCDKYVEMVSDAMLHILTPR